MAENSPKDDPNYVRYTVKELLADIRATLTSMDGKLDGKADRTELIAVQAELRAVKSENDRRISSLESTRATHEAVAAFKRALIVIGVIGIGGLIVSIAVAVLTLLSHHHP